MVVDRSKAFQSLKIEIVDKKMIKLVQLVQLLIVSTIVCDATNGKYTPDWNSLDSRPLPEWFDEAKIGKNH